MLLMPGSEGTNNSNRHDDHYRSVWVFLMNSNFYRVKDHVILWIHRSNNFIFQCLSQVFTPQSPSRWTATIGQYVCPIGPIGLSLFTQHDVANSKTLFRNDKWSLSARRSSNRNHYITSRDLIILGQGSANDLAMVSLDNAAHAKYP